MRVYVHCNPITHFDALGLYAEITTKQMSSGSGFHKKTWTEVNITLNIAFRNESDVSVSASDMKKVADSIAKQWSGDFGDYHVTTTVNVLGPDDIKKMHESQSSLDGPALDDMMTPGARAGKYGFNVITFVNGNEDDEKSTDASGMRNQSTIPISEKGITDKTMRSMMHEAGHLMDADDHSTWQGNLMRSNNDRNNPFDPLKNMTVDSGNIDEIVRGDFNPVSDAVKQRQKEDEGIHVQTQRPGDFNDWADEFLDPGE